MGTLGWIGVPESEIRMVKGTYEDTKSRVLCRPFSYLDGAICGVGGSPISKRKIFGVWLGRWRGCSVKQVKVSSYVAQYLIIRIAHLKRFTLYFPIRPIQSDTISTYLGSIQPYAAINARRLLVYIYSMCILPGRHLYS